MSAARLLCSALVFCGSVLFGAVSGARRKARINETEAVLHDITELANRMELTRSPLSEISDELSKRSAAPSLWQGISTGIAAGSTPGEAFSACGSILKNEAAMSILEELFAGLGSSSIEAEQRRLKLTCAKLNELLSCEKARIDKSLKLTSSLSVLMGLAAALLLL